MPESSEATVLYKILTPAEVESLPDGEWSGTAFDQKDSFIHLSTAHQINNTLSLFFSPKSIPGTELYLLAIPVEVIRPELLKFEKAPNGLIFPHVYGSFTPKSPSIHQILIKRSSPEGDFELPELKF